MSQRISQLAAVTLDGTEQVVVSAPSATVTITGTTISAAASDNSFNDSADGFVAAGFAVGDAVRVQGFTGDTANNIFSAVITGLTIGKMTIGGTDGDVIVDDAAGESVTITKWESARASAQDVADLAAVSQSIAMRYTVDLASQTDGDPGAGKLRFNNATAASATKIFLDDETSDGVDMSTALLDLGSSGYIRIQSAADVGEWLYAKWTAIVDDTGYFDIAITVLASKGTLDDTDAVLVIFDIKGSGGGSTQGKHDVPIEAISMRSRTTNGGTGLQWLDMGAGKPEVGYVSLDPTTQQFFVFGLKMPKSWNEATITYTVDWMHPATTTNFDVEFGLGAAAFGDGDSLNVSYGTAQVVNDTGGATDTVYTTPESSAITIANTPATRDGIQLQLSRNPSGTDNLAVNARVLRVTIYIVTDADTDA
jgi:hypothetical protein